MREDPRDIMFTYIKSILEYYDLPSVFWLLNNPPTKAEWKLILNYKINNMVESEWQTDIESKSSTKYVNPSILKVGTCHHIWSTVRDNIHDSRRAQLKCKLLTGAGLGGAVGCASDWRPGGRGFDPRRGRQHSFVEIDHEIFSTVILSLPLIQEGQLSVSGERMCTILVNRLED